MSDARDRERVPQPVWMLPRTPTARPCSTAADGPGSDARWKWRLAMRSRRRSIGRCAGTVHPQRHVIPGDVAGRIDAFPQQCKLAILGTGFAKPCRQRRRACNAASIRLARASPPRHTRRAAGAAARAGRRRSRSRRGRNRSGLPVRVRERHAAGDRDGLAIARAEPARCKPERRQQLRPGESGEHRGRDRLGAAPPAGRGLRSPPRPPRATMRRQRMHRR